MIARRIRRARCLYDDDEKYVSVLWSQGKAIARPHMPALSVWATVGGRTVDDTQATQCVHRRPHTSRCAHIHEASILTNRRRWLATDTNLQVTTTNSVRCYTVVQRQTVPSTRTQLTIRE